MQPLMQDLATAFTQENPDVEVVIQGNGSAAGLDSVKNDTAQVGAVARPLTSAESAELGDSQVLPVAQNDPIAVIAHILVPVENLTAAQLQQIYAGEVTNWSEVGGPDVPIVVVSSIEGSDTRTVFEETVLGQAGAIAGGGTALEVASDQAVRDTVASRPYALGFTTQKLATTSPEIPEQSNEGWSELDTSLLEVRVLTLDGVEPSPENAANGTYPAARPLNIVTKAPPDPLTQQWIDFIKSPRGQQIIQQAGYTPTP